MSTPGLKLILSRLGNNTKLTKKSDDDDDDDEQQHSKLNILVVSNVGAQRGSDLSEFAEVIQHLAHIIVGQQTASCPCTICRCNGATQLTPELRESIALALGVPAATVVHATTTTPMDKNGKRRERSQQQQQQQQQQSSQDNDDVNDDISPPNFQLLFHYGWSFTVVFLPSALSCCSSAASASSSARHLQALQEVLKKYVASGHRIVKGSAAATAPPPPPDAKITTMPAEGIQSTVESVPLEVFSSLCAVASPGILLAGYPSSGSSLVSSLPTASHHHQHLHIPGLFLQREFLSREWEQKLIALVDSWSAAEWQLLNQRRVKHFGRRFDYKVNDVFQHDAKQGDTPLTQIPIAKEILDAVHLAMDKSGFEFFATGTSEEEQILERGVDQMTVSEYVGGSGIPAHFDHEENFGKLVVAVAVGAPTLFEYTKPGRPDKTSVLFPPRALLIMSGDSRYVWKHAIAARQRDFLFLPQQCEQRVPVSCCCSQQSNGGGGEQLQSVSLERQRRISFTFRRVRLTQPRENGSDPAQK